MKNWGAFWDDSVTAYDEFLVQRLAMFILIPVGVFFHELGHTLATWQVGGQVREFQWRIFWGYIVPVGNFSASDSWWISLSGNVVSITIGLLAIPAIFFVKKQIIKELLYVFAIVEIVYALVVYPIWSFVTQRGDWIKIYDFSVKPYAQLTLLVHLTLVFGLWYLRRSRWILDHLALSKLESNANKQSRNDQDSDMGV